MDRIGSPLRDLLQRLRLAEPMRGWGAVEAWPEIVGARVAGHTRAVSFREGVLMVEVESPAWASELSYLKRRLVADLNGRLGAETIKDIRFVPASRAADESRGERR